MDHVKFLNHETQSLILSTLNDAVDAEPDSQRAKSPVTAPNPLNPEYRHIEWQTKGLWLPSIPATEAFLPGNVSGDASEVEASEWEAASAETPHKAYRAWDRG